MPPSYDIDDPDFDAWDDDNVEDLLHSEADPAAVADHDEPGFDEPCYEDLVSAPANAGSPDPAPPAGETSPPHDREHLRSQARNAAKRLLRDHIAAILPHALQQAGLLAYRAPAERARLHQACMRGLSVEFPVCAGRLFARNDPSGDVVSGVSVPELPVSAVLACTSARLARRFRSELTKQDTDALVSAIADLIPERVLRLEPEPVERVPAAAAEPGAREVARDGSVEQMAHVRRSLIDALETLDGLIDAHSRRTA